MTDRLNELKGIINSLSDSLRNRLLDKLNPLHYDYIVFYPPYELLSPGVLYRIDFKKIEEILSDHSSKLSFYFEIPWCATKCPFCLYHKYTYDPTLVEKYLDTLICELKIYKERLSINKNKVYTIYIGGGTPSLLPGNYLKDFLRKLGDNINLEQLEELSFEIYCPIGFQKFKEIYDTLTQFVQNKKKLRISLGIQSFLSERRHIIRGVEDIQNADCEIRRIIDFGLEKQLNFNIDIMWGLKDKDVGEELEIIDRYLAPLFTFYQIEPPYDIAGFGRFKEVIEDNIDRILQQRCAVFTKMRELEYEHALFPWYFKKKNGTALYSSAQMQKNHYFVGIGLGAHTKLPTISYVNVSDIERYFKKISQKEFPIGYVAILDEKEERRRDLLLGLRIPNNRFTREDLEFVFKDKNELIERFFAKDESYNYQLNEIGKIIVDELIRMGVRWKIKSIEEQVKRKIFSYIKNLKMLRQENFTEILEFSLHCFNVAASEIFKNRYFLNIALKSKKWVVFGKTPLGLRRYKEDWNEKNKQFQSIKGKKFYVFEALFDKIVNEGTIGEIYPFTISGLDISKLNDALDKDLKEAKEKFIESFAPILVTNTRNKVEEFTSLGDIKKYLFIMRLFNIYVKEIAEGKPSNVRLIFSVFKGLISEFIGGYAVAIREEMDKENLGKISSYFEAILNFLADIEQNHQIKNHALRSAVAAIMARNMSHNIGSHVLNYLSDPEVLDEIWVT